MLLPHNANSQEFPEEELLMQRANYEISEHSSSVVMIYTESDYHFFMKLTVVMMCNTQMMLYKFNFIIIQIMLAF